MERYWVANGILASNECGGLVKYDDAQRALDAERERVAFLDKKNVALVEASNLVLKVKAEQDEQLATLQAQLAQPIRVCQGCGRVSRDGWVTARYECDELHGSLQCPDCQCIDLEINTAKELAALCTQAQAQLRQVEGANTKLRDALKTIEAIICDKKLCGHFLAEEIREQTQQALAAKDAGKEVGNGNS